MHSSLQRWCRQIPRPTCLHCSASLIARNTLTTTTPDDDVDDDDHDHDHDHDHDDDDDW